MAQTYSIEDFAGQADPMRVPPDVQAERDRKSLALLNDEKTQYTDPASQAALDKEIAHRQQTIAANDPNGDTASSAATSMSVDDFVGAPSGAAPAIPVSVAPKKGVMSIDDFVGSGDTFPDQTTRGIANQRINAGGAEAKAASQQYIADAANNESVLDTVLRSAKTGGKQFVSGMTNAMVALADNTQPLDQSSAPTGNITQDALGSGARVLGAIGRLLLDKDETTGRYKTPQWAEDLDTGSRVDSSAVASLPVAEAYKQGHFTQWLVGQTAQQSPQVGMLLASLAFPPLAAVTLPAMGASQAGQQYKEDVDNGVNQHDAALDAINNGLAEIGSESLSFGLGKMVGPIYKYLKALGPAEAKTIAGKLVQRALAGAGTVAAESVGEGTSEAAGQLVQNASQKYEAGRSDTDLTESVPESFFGSLGFGPLVTGAHVATKAAQHIANQFRPADKTVASDLLSGESSTGPEPATGPAQEVVQPAAPAAPAVPATAPGLDDAALTQQFDAQAQSAAAQPAKDEGASTPPPVETPVPDAAQPSGIEAGDAQQPADVSAPQPEVVAPQKAQAQEQAAQQDAVRSEDVGVASAVDPAVWTETKGDGSLAIPTTTTEDTILDHLNADRRKRGVAPLPAGSVRVEEPTDAESRVAEAVKKALGVDIVWVTSTEATGIGGFVSNRGGGNRTMYLMRPVGDTHVSTAQFLIGHELTHIMRQEHPDLYAALASELQQFHTEEGKEAAKNRHSVTDADRGNGLGSRLAEEINADYAGNLFVDPAFLDHLQAKNPTLFARAIQVFHSFLNSLGSALQRAHIPNTVFLRDTEQARQHVANAFQKWAERENAARQQEIAVHNQQEAEAAQARQEKARIEAERKAQPATAEKPAVAEIIKKAKASKPKVAKPAQEPKPKVAAVPAATKARVEGEKKAATEGKWQRLMSKPESAANDLTRDEAQQFLDRLNAAPGDNPAARKVLEGIVGSKDEGAATPVTKELTAPEKAARKRVVDRALDRIGQMELDPELRKSTVRAAAKKMLEDGVISKVSHAEVLRTISEMDDAVDALDELKSSVMLDSRDEISASPSRPSHKVFRGVNVEAAPNPDNDEATKAFRGMTPKQQSSATVRVGNKVVMPLLADMGLADHTHIEHVAGGFEGSTNPSMVVLFDDAVPFDRIVEAGHALGVALDQKAVIAFDENDTSGSQAGFVYVQPSRRLAYNEQEAIFGDIVAQMPEAAGFTGLDGDMVFGNFSGMSQAEFHNKLDNALLTASGDATFRSQYDTHRSEYITPDAKETRYGHNQAAEGNEGAAVGGQAVQGGEGYLDSLRRQSARIIAEEAGGISASPASHGAAASFRNGSPDSETRSVGEGREAARGATRHADGLAPAGRNGREGVGVVQDGASRAGARAEGDGRQAGVTPLATDTAAFKRWFGDSKIVNPDGSPKVMYHGTAQDVHQFAGKQAGAIFLTGNPRFAEHFGMLSEEWMTDHAEEILSPEEYKAAVREATLASIKDGEGVRDIKDSGHFFDAVRRRMPSMNNVMPLYVRAENPFDYEDHSHVRAVVEKIIDSMTEAQNASGVSQDLRDDYARRMAAAISTGEWEVVEEPAVQRAIRALGHDSFYVHEQIGANVATEKNLAVYSPNQVKSVMNSGAFSIEDNDISASRSAEEWRAAGEQAQQLYAQHVPLAKIAKELKVSVRGAQSLLGSVFTADTEKHFMVPDQTKAREFERKFVDRFNRVELVQKAIEEQGGTVNDVNNVYLALERMPGRTENRVNDFVDHELRPLIDDAAKAGVSLEDIATYAYLKHAKERNAQIAKINPKMPDGGSGLFNADVDAMQEAQRESSDYAKLKELGERLIAITRGTRDVLEHGGLLSAEERAAWEQYQNYVPLRGGESTAHDIPNSPNSGGFIDQRGKLSKRATGRFTPAVPREIFGNIVQDRFAAIVRSEKNIIGKTLMKFVLDNPDNKLWGVNEEKPSRSIVRNPDGTETVVERRVENRDPNNTVVTKVGGREFVIILKDETLAKALLNLDDQKLGFVLQALSKVNRVLTKLWTQYNPVFTATNFTRDFFTGMTHVTADHGIARAATVMKYVPTSIGAMFRLMRGATTGGLAFSYAQDYVANGGKTGYASLASLDERIKELEGMYKDAMRGKSGIPAKMAKAFIGLISDVNGAIENGIRIASYRAAREAGQSAAQAASEAKNLTVNFNRRGVYAPHMNAMFLFFNPGVQGTARIVKAMKKSPKAMAAITGSMVTVGFLMAMLSSLDDDDDGVSYWDKPDVEQLKSKNLIFIIPGTQGKRLVLPLPYGYNAFFAAGYALADMARRRTSGWHITGQIADALNQAFMPIGSGNVTPISVLPTIAQPLYQIEMNQTAFGSPLYPDHGEGIPDSEKMWAATRGTATEAITTYLNEATGGDATIPGAVSISPESLGYFAKFVSGGVGTAMVDLLNTGAQVSNLGWQDADITRLPFVRQFYGEHKPERDTGLYYERLGALKGVVASYKAAEKAGDEAKTQELKDRYGEQMIEDVGSMISETTQALKEVRDAELAIRQSDDPAGVKELLLRDQAARRGAIFAEFNKAFTEANEGKVALPTPTNLF